MAARLARADLRGRGCVPRFASQTFSSIPSKLRPVVTQPGRSGIGRPKLRGYINEQGNRRFANWLDALDATAAARVTIALTRMEQGNLSNTKRVDSIAAAQACWADYKRRKKQEIR